MYYINYFYVLPYYITCDYTFICIDKSKTHHLIQIKMKSRSNLFSAFQFFAMCFALIAFTSCEKDTDDSPATASNEATMGDPKTSSGGGSSCYELTQFVEDGQDETSDYSNFAFEFFNNGTVVARDGVQDYSGQWAIGFDDGVQKFFLNFSGTIPLLNELSDDWDIVSLNRNAPSFIEDVNNNPGVLSFAKITDCTGGGPSEPSPELDAFNANLTTGGAWSVASFIENGVNETNDYNNVSFTFNADGTVTAQRNAQSRSGQWISTIDNGTIELIIGFQGPAVLNELNEDWVVVSSTATALDLEDIGPGENSTLSLSRD
jgi:hypothetical protein